MRKDSDVCDYVRYYNHGDFKNFSMVGSGGSASVHVAEWKNTRAKFAIKKFAESSTEEEIINEVWYSFVYIDVYIDKL